MSNGHDDPYGVEDCQSFVKVVEDEDVDDFMELPTEHDGTILLSTLQGQFPNAFGLRYKSTSGGWRGVRISGDVLNPPHSGWGDTTYYITLAKESGAKRKTEDLSKEEEVLTKTSKKDIQKSAIKPSEKHFLQDMIVLSLPFNCQDKDLKEYFTNACGDMSLHEVKFDRQTKKPRGFGFIRMKTVEGAKAALTGEHSIMGRKIEIRLSNRKEEPMKLFVGRIPEGTSPEELKAYFADFGEVKDVYIPQPFRGFGFVTYASSEDGRAALRRNHKIGDTRLNVQFAEPKEEKMARRRREEERYVEESGRGSSQGYDYDHVESRDSRDNWDNRHRGRDSRDERGGKEERYGSRNEYDSRDREYRDQHGAVDSRNTASELKNMLYSILSGGH